MDNGNSLFNITLDAEAPDVAQDQGIPDVGVAQLCDAVPTLCSVGWGDLPGAAPRKEPAQLVPGRRSAPLGGQA